MSILQNVTRGSLLHGSGFLAIGAGSRAETEADAWVREEIAAALASGRRAAAGFWRMGAAAGVTSAISPRAGKIVRLHAGWSG